MSERYCTVPKILGLRKWFEGKYGLCCEQHDYDYSELSDMDRLKADLNMKKCMIDKGASRATAFIAFRAVRMLGFRRYKGTGDNG